MMIRSCRIPAILSRICNNTTDNDNNSVIQIAMLVTNDGELLGSTSATFVNPDGVRESIENLGTLIADIAVDYQRLGDEFAGLEGGGAGGGDQQQQHHLYDTSLQDSHQQPPQPLVPTNQATWSASTSNSSSNSNVSGGGGGGAGGGGNGGVTSGAGTTTTMMKKASHLQFLLLELEQGLIGVSTCVGIDCMVIAIAGSLDAPPGLIKASLLSMAEHVQEGLSPLTETVSYR
jgi:hypothetical protein